MKTPVAPLPCQHLGVASVLKFGYLNRCIMISHFNLQVPNDIWWTSRVALVVKNLPANAGDIGDVCLIPGLGRSPGGGHGNPLQYFYMENYMSRRAWWAAVHIGSQRVGRDWSDLTHSNDIWHWLSLHLLIWGLYIFFGEVFVPVFCPYFNQVVCFF